MEPKVTTESIVLNLVLLLPLAGALPLWFIPETKKRAIRLWSLAVALATFVLSLVLLARFNGGALPRFTMQFLTDVPWIASFNVHYKIGVDGISLFLLILTTFLTPIVIVGSSSGIRDRVREFHAMLLILETGMIGAFVSLDLILFYVFWEAMLIPMYFLIGIWGGGRRVYAAVKFFLYTMVGSLLMLVAILYLAYARSRQTGFGDLTFDVVRLYTVRLPLVTQAWLFAAFALSFAIKVPLFPFHTWLPDAHVEAPTGGSVILAGILLKMGTYGFLRFAIPLFPAVVVQPIPLFPHYSILGIDVPGVTFHVVPVVFTICVIGILYGAWVSTVQPDLKKLVAYSSVSHLALVVLGMFALNLNGIEGAIIQMVNHGLSTGALFLLVGIVYERRHTRQIADYGGLAKVMPVYATLFVIVALSSSGLPGLNGFVGELLILLGVFRMPHWWPFALVAVTGLIWGAVYLLRTVQRVFFGPLDKDENRVLKDLTLREFAVLLAVVIPIFGIGLYPRPMLQMMEPSVKGLIEHVNQWGGGVSRPVFQAPAVPAPPPPAPGEQIGNQ